VVYGLDLSRRDGIYGKLARRNDIKIERLEKRDEILGNALNIDANVLPNNGLDGGVLEKRDEILGDTIDNDATEIANIALRGGVLNKRDENSHTSPSLVKRCLCVSIMYVK